MKHYILLSIAIAIFSISTQAMAASRIITIGSGASEIVVALGAESKIIATDLTSRYPKSLQDLPSVGYIRSINAENVIAMRPDVVITTAGFRPTKHLKYLRNTGIKVIVLPVVANINDIYRNIAIVSKAISKKKEGATLTRSIKKDYKKVKTLFTKIKKQPKIMAIMHSNKGISVAGGTTSFGRIVSMAKGNNIFQSLQFYKVVNDEAIIQANPDIILVLEHSLKGNSLKSIKNHPAIIRTNAGKNQKIYAINSVKVLSFGPRIIEVLTTLSQIFYPKLIKN